MSSEPRAGAPTLVACSHGTDSPDGQAVIRELVEDVRAATNCSVLETFVDVQYPQVDEVVHGIPAKPGELAAVVVPLLLAGGFHVYVDIARAVENRDDVVAAPALGPDPRLIDIVLDRVAEAHVPPTATLVLAAAGSSDERSLRDTEAAADMLRQHWGGPVRVGFAAGQKPSVADAVAEAREFGEEYVAVASFLLAPGFFQRRIEQSGADWITGPLAPDSRIVEIVIERYRSECGLHSA